MKIKILAIGKLKKKFLIDAVAEYLKRLQNHATVKIIELNEQRTVDEECEILISHISKDEWTCLLDVHGEEMPSEKLAQIISSLTLHGQSNLTFIIGGAFGINDKLRKAVDFRLSLSKMTFTHQMTRLILIEQIYRAFKINSGEPYHW